MPQPEPSFINQLQPYRPPCSRCGAQTVLARIEPASEAGHDVRTFSCPTCGNSETMNVAYR
jgi:ribosomal protein S27AE